MLIPRICILSGCRFTLFRELYNFLAGLPNNVNERENGHGVERCGHGGRHTRQTRNERAKMPGKANADLFP